MTKKEAPEVSFHRGEVHVIYGFLDPEGVTSVTFGKNSHGAQNWNNTWWQFIVTNKVRMQQQEGEKQPKAQTKELFEYGKGDVAKGGCQKHNTWKQTENTSS